MAALSPIHDFTGRRLVSSIYSWDTGIYGVPSILTRFTSGALLKSLSPWAPLQVSAKTTPNPTWNVPRGSPPFRCTYFRYLRTLSWQGVLQFRDILSRYENYPTGFYANLTNCQHLNTRIYWQTTEQFEIEEFLREPLSPYTGPDIGQLAH
jgi:hypothetical protein